MQSPDTIQDSTVFIHDDWHLDAVLTKLAGCIAGIAVELVDIGRQQPPHLHCLRPEARERVIRVGQRFQKVAQCLSRHLTMLNISEGKIIGSAIEGQVQTCRVSHHLCQNMRKVASGCLVFSGKSAGKPAFFCFIVCRFALPLSAVRFGLGWPQVIYGAAPAALDFHVSGKCAARFKQEGGACAAANVFHFLTLGNLSITALCLRAERVDN